MAAIVIESDSFLDDFRFLCVMVQTFKEPNCFVGVLEMPQRFRLHTEVKILS